jgi:hypothetical protein
MDLENAKLKDAIRSLTHERDLFAIRAKQLESENEKLRKERVENAEARLKYIRMSLD